ncbi:hypothetical protein EDD18DRAFT_1109965 [Armillaria luteobubalina]|uniref:RING-type domain-containing protein n=1 Tax=Armillaria luteobubalina TaxID=153913 RepID=A0AA39PTL0_9AGAR|nr:hypothetical protein EDD18DRAFT_1109965 [Armillaria luteobubalina]
MQKISKLEELLKELEVENTRKSLEIGMHYHLKTVAVEERDSIATHLNDAQDELKSVGRRLEEATVALLNMQTTSRFQAEEREQLLVRLNNGEVQLRTTEQRLGDTEARMLNMVSLADSRMAEFQQEKDYLVNEVIKFTQKEKELLTENVQWQQEFARLHQEHQGSSAEIQKLKDVIDNIRQKVQSCMECNICCFLNVVPVELDCGHGLCGNCVIVLLSEKPRSATCPACREPISQKPSVDRSLKEVIHALLKIVEPTEILDQIGDVNFDEETRKIQLKLDDHFRRYS